MKKIPLLIIFAMFFSISNAANYNLTFEEARQKAVNNSDKIKLQQQIIDSLEKKYALQKDNARENKPDYEYNYINKTPVYNNSYQTFDYDKLLKSAKDVKKNMIISNEQTTIQLFSDIINTQNDVRNKMIEISNQENIIKQASAKLKTGSIIQLEYDNEVLKLDNLNSQLKVLENKVTINENKLKNHMNISEKDTITLKLVEPKIDMLLPEDMIYKLDNKKSLKDLQEELNDLNDDLKWISVVNTGSNYTTGVEKQEKLIKQKKQDISELKRKTLHNYDRIYIQILIKSNEIALDKINKSILENNNKKNTTLYNKGIITKNSINDTNAQITQNILSQIKKQLEIRQMLLEYNE